MKTKSGFRVGLGGGIKGSLDGIIVPLSGNEGPLGGNGDPLDGNDVDLSTSFDTNKGSSLRGCGVGLRKQKNKNPTWVNYPRVWSQNFHLKDYFFD